MSTYSSHGFPLIGDTASTPNRSNHGRLSIPARARHNPTDVALPSRGGATATTQSPPGTLGTVTVMIDDAISGCLPPGE
ncbi:hypothetical protein GCM10009789_40350 [Kribbella sancticallisti]|uniref:Uncharacterized protein n=1 Tax=Kribbella sancticallisti TaxID=460087 RepID=A0ABN2DPK2_9ACTN